MRRMEIWYEPYDPATWVALPDGADAPRTFSLTHRPGDPADEPGWTVRFEIVDGAVRCREVTVSAGDGQEIRSRDLRNLRVEELAGEALAEVASRRVTDEDGRVLAVRDLATRRPRPHRRARPRITDELLTEVAQVYRDHVDRNPTAAVAEHFELSSDRTARLYVRRARTAGLLGPATPGRAGER